MCRHAFDLGITHFDLANNYGPPAGSAESNFGEILRRDFSGYRDELIISTKAGYWMWDGPYGDLGSRKYLTASLDQSLKRLGLDYVDIFYSHRFDPETPLEETMGALGQGPAFGQGALRGHLLLQRPAHQGGQRHLKGVWSALPDPSAQLLHA
jgi:L-glyceraldehyde 3-phosphate reductase